MKVIIYTHDTFGLGNISRMLSIAEHLNSSVEDISLLLISGSPMLHSFRLSKGIDYVKLPTISRTIQGKYHSRTLGLSIQDSVKMRSNLILSTVTDFRPDIILVDKKPLGLKKELSPTLQFLQQNMPSTRVILVLRDILDAAKTTKKYWKKKGYFDAIDRHYERILILGCKAVYDSSRIYRFPLSCLEKVHYCGYLKKTHSHLKSTQWVRNQLGIQQEKIVLVTIGGGADGEHVLKGFMEFWHKQNLGKNVHAVVIHGPELSSLAQQHLTEYSKQCKQMTLLEFTPDLPSFMNAAEVLVCMAGYNTLCEALSLGKRIICIPRVKPVQEQLIRAKRFSQLQLLQYIHPDDLTPEKLAMAVGQILETKQHVAPATVLQFGALDQVRQQLLEPKSYLPELSSQYKPTNTKLTPLLPLNYAFSK